MANYDAVAGVDQKTLNALIASIYKVVYPNAFKGSIPVEKFNIASVDYDIQTAPVITLAPSALVRDMRSPHLEAALSGDSLRAALVEAAQSSFTVEVNPIAVTINYDDQPPTVTSGSIQAGGEVQTDPDGTLTMTILNGEIVIPDDQIVTEILNKVFVQMLISYLNEHVLNPIQIPPLDFKDVKLSMPMVLTQNYAALAFLVLQPGQVVPPDPGTWPADRVFIGSDAPLLDAVANAVLPGEHGDWSWSCDIGICDLKLGANYDASLIDAHFDLTPDPGSSVTCSLTASASVNFSAKCGIFSDTFGALATARPTVTASVSAIGSEVCVTFEDLGKVHFHFEFRGVPWWLTTYVCELIANALAPVLAAVITSILKGYRFPVFTIPLIPVTIAGISFTIQLTQLALSTIAAPDGKALLTVTGFPEVIPSSVTAEARVTRVTRRIGETEERK